MIKRSLFSALLIASQLSLADVLADTNLVIYRTDDGRALNYRTWVNGDYQGKLDQGTVLRLSLPAGTHEVKTNDARRSTLQVEVDNASVAYVQVETSRRNKMDLREVSEEVAANHGVVVDERLALNQ